MTTQTVITIDHVRAVGLCVNGTRTGLRVTIWTSAPSCVRAVTAETLLATGDAMALAGGRARARIRQEHD
jgi:hypothetical protein